MVSQSLFVSVIFIFGARIVSHVTGCVFVVSCEVGCGDGALIELREKLRSKRAASPRLCLL